MQSRVIVLSLCCCLVQASEIYRPESQYVNRVMENCAQQLYELTACLRHASTMLNKIRRCDDRLAYAFICLSNEPEVPHAQAQNEAIQDGDVYVIKRGLGRCIHNCLQGKGQMNFIQCKSMCH